MKSSGKAFFGSIVMSMILIASIVSLVAATGGTSTPPMMFGGTLTIDGADAPAGTNVVGYANGIDKTVPVSPYVTITPGFYGETNSIYLLVNCTDGQEITFRVNGDLAPQSATCAPGQVQWLPLTVGEPQGEPEICDGIDNDYDGEIDEDFPDLGDPCSAGIGECQVFGDMVCTIDGTGTECSAVAGTGDPEICDGIDNDCDGQTDEDYTDLGDPCSVGLGECQADGVMVCAVTHDGTECSAIAGIPITEICNGLDDDCDGATDEGIAPRSCGLTDLGECTYGIETCTAGDWTGCTAILPSAEVCTGGLDDDCDGYTDCNDMDCVQDPACEEPPEEFCIQILSMRILNNDFIEDYYIMPGEMYNVEVVNYNACEEPVESMQIVQVDKIGNTPVNIGTVKSTIAPYTTSTVTVGFVLPGVGMGTDFEANAYNWNHWISQDPGTWEALSAPASIGFEAGTGPL